MSEPARAIEAWREVLGPGAVVVDEAERAAAETATFATDQRIPAILRPGSRAEVQACLRIATRFAVPVSPVSRGRNWGNGSRVPVRDGCVLLDLSRMDRIVDYDEDLAYVTVEPGVTFAGLDGHLRARGSKLMVGAPGTSPQASVIGNALERGHGSGLHVDRAAHVCAMEIVLATGECVHTGFGRFPGARSAPVHRWGVGPALDGLFTQSNLGVVTRMTVWLAPIPPIVQSCLFRLDDDGLERLLPEVRRLKAGGLFTGLTTIWNRHKGAALHGQYPWSRADGRTTLDAAALARLPGGDAAWTGLAGLYAQTEPQAREQRAIVRRALGPCVDHLAFADHDGLRIHADAAAGPPEGGLAPRDPRETLLIGAPSEASVATTYWRKRRPPPAAGADPDRDGVGLLWCLPSLPFAAGDVRRAVELVEAACLRHGFEPQVALICVSERSIDATVLLAYDREVEGEDARALACHDDLIGRLIDEGFPPYRLGLQSMSALPPASDDTASVLARLKRELDPGNILAPGRYIPDPVEGPTSAARGHPRTASTCRSSAVS